MALRILALDTATEACSAALLIDDSVSVRRFELAPRRHAALILPMLDQVLAEAGVILSEIDAVAFGCGPGAFTGVRIAASVSQGIAYAKDLPVLAISTLAAMAHGGVRELAAERFAVAIDARMAEVYWAQYIADSEQGVRCLSDEVVAPPSQLAVISPAQAWCGLGSGWQSYGESLRARLAVVQCWPERYPDASDVALLAAHAWRRGEAVSAEQALPVYLRDRVATAASG